MSGRKKPRGLRPDEMELWQRVSETARPLHPKRKQKLEAVVPKPPVVQLPEAAPLKPFRIEGPRRPMLSADLSPDLGARLRGQPVAMDAKTHGKMRKGKLAPEARLDLHGMTLERAHPVLNSFILRAQADGKRLVLVISGKGRAGPDMGPIPVPRGLLRHQVPIWLNAPMLRPAVLQVTEAHARHGGSGAYYVYLRRGR